MASTAQYANAPHVSVGTITQGDFSRTAPTQSVVVLTPSGTNGVGTYISRIVAQAEGATVASTIRLWLSYNGATTLWQEMALPAVTPGGTTTAATVSLSAASNPNILPITLQMGMVLKATVNDTQVAIPANIQSITANGTLNGCVTLGNGQAGFTNTAASAAAIAALQTTTGAAALTQTAYPYIPAAPSTVTLTSTGNISGVNFTIIGTDLTGATINEVLAGPNNNTVYSLYSYASVSSIMPNGAVGTNTSAGINSSVLFNTTPSKITLSSAANVSGVNFTIRGISASGASINEVLAGPTAGNTVSSVNTYKAVTYINAPSSAVATSIGTPAFITPITVTAQAGDM